MKQFESISELKRFLTVPYAEEIAGFDERKLVAIMGGHSILRTSPTYRQVALLSKSLTEQGCSPSKRWRNAAICITSTWVSIVTMKRL